MGPILKCLFWTKNYNFEAWRKQRGVKTTLADLIYRFTLWHWYNNAWCGGLINIFGDLDAVFREDFFSLLCSI